MLFKSWRIVYPVLPRSSWFSLGVMVRLLALVFYHLPCVVHAPAKISFLSLMMNLIIFQFCPLPERFVSYFVLPGYTQSSLKLVMGTFLFFLCVTNRCHSSALYSSVDMTKDSYNLTLTFKLICLLFHISFSLPNTLLALPVLSWQSLSQLPLLVTQLLSCPDPPLSQQLILQFLLRYCLARHLRP